jgi:predicted secreted protein
MPTHTTSRSSVSALTARGPLFALRTLAMLSTLSVLFQGLTAGELLMRSHTARDLHETGAIVLHVLTGLTMVAAAVYWRATRAGLWTTVLAAVVFGVTFVQASFGHDRTLYIHVPLALLLLLGAAWVLAWSWLAPRPTLGTGADAPR